MDEPVVGGGECGVALAVDFGAGEGMAGGERDVEVRLKVLRKVVDYVVGMCAGTGGMGGDGGTARLTMKEGGVVDVTVQRPV